LILGLYFSRQTGFHHCEMHRLVIFLIINFLSWQGPKICTTEPEATLSLTLTFARLCSAGT